MHTSKSRLKDLHELLVAGKATEKEKEEFFDLLLEADPEEQLSPMMREYWESIQHTGTADRQKVDEIADRIFEKYPVQNVVPLYKRGWMRYAAAILIIAGAAGYIFFNLTKKQDSITIAKYTPVKEQIVPGGNKAYLTLADGSIIVLDSSGNGTIAQQPGSSIIKSQDGKLVYQKLKEGEMPVSAFNSLSTPRGGQYHVTLPDGSEVWLNSASSIRFPVVFSKDKREIELAGEGYFEVKEDKTRPFIVKTKTLDITVLGTGFNINAYDDEPAVATTLVHGSVKATSAEGSTLLKPGQQVSRDYTERRLVTSIPNLEEVLAWRDGKFKFEGATIQSIMRQIARWYDVKVVYKGKIPETEFNGSLLRTAYPSMLLDALELTKKVHFIIEGKTITVVPGAKPGK